MDEQELILSSQKGNLNAFEHLIKQHKDMVYSLCMNIIGNKTTAEDISQEVFLKVFKKIKSFDFSSDFKTWLYRITYNKCIDEIRKQKRFRRFKGKLNKKEQEYSYQEDNSSKKVIMDSLESLNDKDRALLSMFYIQELHLREIEDILDVDSDVLKVRLHRARKRLQSIIEKNYSSEIEDVING